MDLNVGIDVSKAKLDYCGMTSEKEEAFHGTAPNSPKGTVQIRKQIVAWAHQHSDLKQVTIGLEATSVYNILPTFYFEKSKDLGQVNTTVVTLNPKMTHRFNQVYDTDKTDTMDAYHIADFLRVGRYPVPVPRDEKHFALQRLTRERYHLVQQMTDCKNHFLNNLFYRVSAAKADIPTSVFGEAMMTLLSGEKYSLRQVSRLPLADLTQEIKRLSHGNFRDPEKIAKAVKKAITDSYNLGNTINDSVNQVLAIYVSQIRMLTRQIKELDKSIASLVEVIDGDKSMQSIGGIGPVYSAGLLAEIGQPERFPNQASLASYAGLSWRRSQSGAHERPLTPRTHGGDQYLRYYLVEAADKVRQHDPAFAKYYQKKYEEVPKYQHRRACILTARKLVRLIYRLLTKHELYEPAKMV